MKFVQHKIWYFDQYGSSVLIGTKDRQSDRYGVVENAGILFT